MGHSLLFRRAACSVTILTLQVAFLQHTSKYLNTTKVGFLLGLGHPPRTWGVTKLLLLRVKGEGKGCALAGNVNTVR